MSDEVVPCPKCGEEMRQRVDGTELVIVCPKCPDEKGKLQPIAYNNAGIV